MIFPISSDGNLASQIYKSNQQIQLFTKSPIKNSGSLGFVLGVDIPLPISSLYYWWWKCRSLLACSIAHARTPTDYFYFTQSVLGVPRWISHKSTALGFPLDLKRRSSDKPQAAIGGNILYKIISSTFTNNLYLNSYINNSICPRNCSPISGMIYINTSYNDNLQLTDKRDIIDDKFTLISWIYGQIDMKTGYYMMHVDFTHNKNNNDTKISKLKWYTTIKIANIWNSLKFNGIPVWMTLCDSFRTYIIDLYMDNYYLDMHVFDAKCDFISVVNLSRWFANLKLMIYHNFIGLCDCCISYYIIHHHCSDNIFDNIWKYDYWFACNPLLKITLNLRFAHSYILYKNVAICLNTSLPHSLSSANLSSIILCKLHSYFDLCCVFLMDPKEAYKNALLNIETSSAGVNPDVSPLTNANQFAPLMSETNTPPTNNPQNQPTLSDQFSNDPVVSSGFIPHHSASFSNPYLIPNVLALESKLAEFSLVAKFVQGSVDLRQVMGKFKLEWKSLKGQFLCEDIGNDWLIFKFANKEDRNSVWENRPYHVQGYLLALYQWHESFDPTFHDTTIVDLWLRISGLPHQLLTPTAIELILRENGVGNLIRLDPASNMRYKLKFIRCCVTVDLTRPLTCAVNILRSNGSMLALKVWYEDFSDGCGFCGGGDHPYDECHLNRPQPRKFQIVLDDNTSHESPLNYQMSSPFPSSAQVSLPATSPIAVSVGPNTYPNCTINSTTEIGSSSNPIFTPSIINQLPLNCFPQMINPELYRQFVALHNLNPSIPHPIENLALPTNAQISPNVSLADMIPADNNENSLLAVVAQQLVDNDDTGKSKDTLKEPSKSDSTIVKRMEKVAIKHGDHSSTDSDPGKRKDDQEAKEITSPKTKRARKKKN